jgi:hypothetical protein
MPTFVTTTARQLARLAWAFLYLLASRPAHRYPWFAGARRVGTPVPTKRMHCADVSVGTGCPPYD